jgi:hypothetical protein
MTWEIGIFMDILGQVILLLLLGEDLAEPLQSGLLTGAAQHRPLDKAADLLKDKQCPGS